MNDYVDKDVFGFEPDDEKETFDYNDLCGLGQSDYVNEDIFNVEVDNDSSSFVEFSSQNDEEQFNYDVDDSVEDETSNSFIDYDDNYLEFDDVADEIIDYDSNEEFNSEDDENQINDFDFQNNSVVEEANTDDFENAEIIGDDVSVIDNNESLDIDEKIEDVENIEYTNSSNKENEKDDLISDIEQDNVTETLEEIEQSENDELTPIYSEIGEESNDEDQKQTEIFSGATIEELNKLTEYSEEKIQTTDIKALFERVGVNVKEASDIFKKNTEMKEKIDSRFEQLKKLQLEVEKAKKVQYDEINTYKEEVLSKLTDKKDEIEKRLNKLKEFQTSLEKEKQEFEQYRKTEKEEIERVQREVQDAYDMRREELSHIEDVLRKQKDALDEERNQLSLDRIQYEADKNELANNLLKFNEIVDSFTNGMDKINKE